MNEFKKKLLEERKENLRVAMLSGMITWFQYVHEMVKL